MIMKLTYKLGRFKAFQPRKLTQLINQSRNIEFTQLKGRLMMQRRLLPSIGRKETSKPN